MPHGRPDPRGGGGSGHGARLKYHGGVPKAELNQENLEALEKGLPNLLQHVGNIKNVYGLPCVVAINAFPTDTKAELDLVEAKCRELGVNVALSEVWAKGGEGGRALAQEVVRLCEEENHFQYAYDTQLPIEEKLEAIVKKIYHGDGVVLTPAAKKQVKQLTDLGLWGSSHLHGQDPVLLLRRPRPAGSPQGFHGHRPECEGVRGGGLPGGPHRRHHDHARPAQGPIRGKD